MENEDQVDSGNACCRSVQNDVSSRLLYKRFFLFCAIVKLGLARYGRNGGIDVRKWGDKEDIGA
jgi:hypothetical protein